MLALQRTKCRCPLRIFFDLPLILLLGTSDSLVLLLLSLDEGKNQVFSSNWIDGLFVNAFIVGCFDERLYESLRRELGVLEGAAREEGAVEGDGGERRATDNHARRGH